MYPSPFNDFAGPRGEILKALVELGEDPAFMQRAQKVDEAWTQLRRQCRFQREMMLRWPWMHLNILASRLKNNWSPLARYLADESQVVYFEALHKDWKGSLESRTTSTNTWSSTRRLLGDFVDSVNQFNGKWSEYLHGLDLKEVNRLRRDYNTYYPVEKTCAFDCQDIGRLGFIPLESATIEQLNTEFPPLEIPKLRGH